MMIRDDLDSMPEFVYRASPLRIIAALLTFMLFVGVLCALIFRWTETPPEQQPYAEPIRTRPLGGPTT